MKKHRTGRTEYQPIKTVSVGHFGINAEAGNPSHIYVVRNLQGK